MKRRLFAILILVLVLVGSLTWAGSTRAQSDGIDWSGDLFQILAYDHPEIILGVFYQFGITPNDSNMPYRSYNEVFAEFDLDTGFGEGEFCYFDNYQGSGRTQSFPHEQRMQFLLWGPPDARMGVMTESNYKILGIQRMQLEGLNVVYVNYSNSNLPNESKAQEAHIEFIPGSGEYFTWFIEENCVGTFGDNMPAVADVLSATLQIMKFYGFLTPLELGVEIEEPEPYIYVAPILPSGPGADLAGYAEATQMDPTLPPAMTVGAALGAILGLLLTQAVPALARRPKLPAAPAEPVYYSYATGKPASLEQYQQERALMDAGHVYRDGEWHAPKGEYRSETPAYATSQAEQARDQVRADFQQWKAESQARIQAEKASDIRARMASHQFDAALANRKAAAFDVASSVAKGVAGASLDIVSSYLTGRIPLKSIEAVARYAKYLMPRKFPAEKVVRYTKYLVNEAVQQGVIVVKNVASWAVGDGTSYGQDQLVHVFTKPLDFIPGLNASDPTVRQLLFQENIKQGIGKIVDYFTGAVQGGK